MSTWYGHPNQNAMSNYTYTGAGIAFPGNSNVTITNNTITTPCSTNVQAGFTYTVPAYYTFPTTTYTSGQVLVNTGSGGVVWAIPTTTNNLSKQNEDFLINNVKSIFMNRLYTFDLDIEYDLVANTYFTLIENELIDDMPKYTNIKDFFKPRRSLAVIAYDLELNRLEMSAVCKEEMPMTNIDLLLDDKLQIKESKEDYFNVIRANNLPIVNWAVSEFKQDGMTLTKNLNSGILPFVHVSNYLYNLGSNASFQEKRASKILDFIMQDAYLINKKALPDVLPYMSPEYCYLTFKDKTEINKALSVFNKSKQGLINLLTEISVPGTKVIEFVNAVLEQCAANQSILNTEEYMYLKIRHLIETNI